MAIIAVRAWYLQEYEPIRELEKRPKADLRLNKNSLLKTGLRADFLDDKDEVRRSAWFERYLEGDPVEFYIEGSGGYAVANIDLISQEIYFTKQDVMARLDPTIYFSLATENPSLSDDLRSGLQEAIAHLNQRSRLTLSLEEAQRPDTGLLRPSNSRMRKLRQSLLFIADMTPVATAKDRFGNPARGIPSPTVCVELGYALQSKRREQILLVQQLSEDTPKELPFDWPSLQMIQFRDRAELEEILPGAIEAQLQRYSLFS
jgi:hypothetical protein